MDPYLFDPVACQIKFNVLGQYAIVLWHTFSVVAWYVKIAYNTGFANVQIPKRCFLANNSYAKPFNDMPEI